MGPRLSIITVRLLDDSYPRDAQSTPTHFLDGFLPEDNLATDELYHQSVRSLATCQCNRDDELDTDDVLFWYEKTAEIVDA